MAAVDGVVNIEGGPAGLELLKADLTGATSTYVSKKFNTLIFASVNVRGTNTMTYTISGITITITGTNNDTVDIAIAGLKWKQKIVLLFLLMKKEV